MKKFALVMVSPRAFPDLGGIESHIFEVSTRSAPDLESMRVVTTYRYRDVPTVEEVSGVVIERFKAWPKDRDYYLSPGLFVRLLRARYDLLHVQGVHTLVPPLAIVAALVTRRPFVVTFHTGGSSSWLRNVSRSTQFRLQAPLLRRASALVAVSEYERDLFSQWLGLPSRRIDVIRNGGDSADSSGVDRPRRPWLIVSVGRLEKYKGHHRLIEALPELLRIDRRYRAKIVGQGPYEAELRSLAVRLGVHEAVEFTYVPPRDREQMHQVLAEADVAVLLSDYEAHPVVVMEALAAGTPVVVRETSGMTELVSKGWVRGVPGDASSRAIGEAVHLQIMEPRLPPPSALPTWESSVRELHEVYERVLETSSGDTGKRWRSLSGSR